MQQVKNVALSKIENLPIPKKEKEFIDHDVKYLAMLSELDERQVIFLTKHFNQRLKTTIPFSKYPLYLKFIC